MGSVRSGQASSRPATISSARSAWRDPTTTSFTGDGQSDSQSPPGRPGAPHNSDSHDPYPCTRNHSHRARGSIPGCGRAIPVDREQDGILTRGMGLLEGKRILVTGVLTDASLAFAVARMAQREGAEVVLSGAGRGLSLTKRTARKLPRGRRRGGDRCHPARAVGRGGRHGGLPLGPDGRHAPRHRLRPTRMPGRGHVPGRLGAGPDGSPRLGLLAQVAHRRLPPAPAGGRRGRPPGGLGGGPRLRCHRGLAGVQLDGGVQGRPGVAVPLSGPGPRAPSGSGSTWWRRAR